MEIHDDELIKFEAEGPAPLPEMNEQGYVENDGARIWYASYGSGSPVILAGTRTVVGVNNTGNDSGERCTMNNPCEIDQNGNVEAHEGFSYGQQTYWIYSCLNERLELDLHKAGCLLYH